MCLKNDAKTTTNPNPRISIRTRLDIFKRILKGVIAIQEANLIHGDLKPNNILISIRNDMLRDMLTFDSVVIVDFGQAKLISEMMYEMAGTPAFAAPEQASGIRCMKSDNYALGIILASLAMEWNTFWSYIFKGQKSTVFRDQLLSHQNTYFPMIINIITKLICVSIAISEYIINTVLLLTSNNKKFVNVILE